MGSTQIGRRRRFRRFLLNRQNQRDQRGVAPADCCTGGTTSPQKPTKEEPPFICTSGVPVSLSFKSQQSPLSGKTGKTRETREGWHLLTFVPEARRAYKANHVYSKSPQFDTQQSPLSGLFEKTSAATAAGFARSSQLRSCRPWKVVLSVREGGMDHPSHHKSHSLPANQVGLCVGSSLQPSASLLETQANGDSRSIMKGVHPWLVGTLGFSCQLKEIFVLGCFSTKYFILTVPYTTYSILLHLSPSPSKLGRQSCRIACLLICVSVIETIPFILLVAT